MAEKVFLQNGGVTITNKRAELGGQTYAMRNVGSVSLTTLSPGCMVWGAAIGGVLVGVSSIASWDEVGPAGLLLAIVTLPICAFLIFKPKRAVVLRTNSGEQRALVTRNKSRAEQVLSALNEAIVAGPGESSE